LSDGGFVIVRDHFLHETAHEWTDGYAGLPYAVTQAMFFRPDTPVTITINDIATTFARPANYLKYLSGVALYARDRWDTPMSGLRTLDFPEMAQIVKHCNAAMLELYAAIAALPWDERIRNGVKVYDREFLLPFARSIGMWDHMMAAGFGEFTTLTEAVYPALTSGTGEAQQVLGAVFLLGHGLVPESGLGAPPAVGPEAFPSLHAISLRGMVTEPLADAAALLAGELVDTMPNGGLMLTDRGRTRHAELLDAERAGLDLDALATIYERFLALNTTFKAVAVRAAGAAAEDRPQLLEEIAKLVARAQNMVSRSVEHLPRLAGYADSLGAALDRAEAGEWQWLTAPQLDSVHTVWMHLHEDYLQTLGRDREAEGSF
jgi:hypothetical protein